jgi:mxaL protein
MNVADQPLGGKLVPRMLAAKAALAQAVDRLPCGSKLGWGVFTEHRSFLLLSPIEVCEHRRELQATLSGIDGRMAWSGNSEVAKGLNSGMQIVKALENEPALVFVTDGHEAPPVNPRYRPSFSFDRGAVRGLIVGVGGDAPQPIPKIDPLGRPLGDWEADEVLQVDPRSLGRGGSVSGEQMVEPDEREVAPLPGATPGSEHLSSLREGYLQLLASETGIGYLRLHEGTALAPAWLRRDAVTRLTRPAQALFDLRPALAGLAALLLVGPVIARGLGSLWRRLRGMLRKPQRPVSA